jgi:uncharacterized protein (DUF58 family)
LAEVGFDQLRIWTTFPFGIVKKSITISQPQHTLIYPLLYELRPEVLGAVAPQGLSGTKISPHTGAGDDYYGMREFRPGDQLRQIAWKRTACLDQLVCLERTKPTPPRLRVVVNLTTPTDRLPVKDDGDTSARALEERAISLAASIVHAADRNGFEVGLTLPGIGQPSLLIRRSHWHRSKIMAALAGIDLDAPRVPPGPAPATYGERAGQIVIHPHRVEPALGRDDALHLTAGQLATLTVRAVGWDPEESPAGDRQTEVAA